MPTTRSVRAALTFPVGRTHRLLKQGKYGRIGNTAPVYLAAVLEYLVAEIWELAGNSTRSTHRSRVLPRFVALAIRSDAELNELFKDVTIASGGVLPGMVSQ